MATAAALSVTEPASTGLGGDMFCLFYHAGTGQVSALNGSGRAPAALTLERLHREGFGELPPTHPYTITVPGACAGWCDLIERHGSLPLAEVLAPAMRLAEEGFPVAPVTSLGWQEAAGDNLATALNGGELTVDGRAPRPGELFHNPGLARTLKTVAEGGKKAFYEGEIAEAVAAAVQQAGGCLTPADLAAHASTWEAPISTTYAGLRLWECPPNGQGLTALMAVNLLEGFDLTALDPLSADRLHLEIEALRLAFADAGWFVADPAKIKVPVEELLSKGYAAERRKLIDPQRASLDQKHGSPLAGSDTVYFCVVDQLGNACSFINSLYMRFGTGIVPSGWGFALQNRGHNFSLDPQHPNALAPGKRPYHTIIPALITSPHPSPLSQGERDWAYFRPASAVGLCLAGVYPLGMELVRAGCRKCAGAALAQLVGMLTLGTALPHGIRLAGAGWSWQATQIPLLSRWHWWQRPMIFGLGDGPHLKRRHDAPPLALWGGCSHGFLVQEFPASALGYFGHQWELYAFWDAGPGAGATRVGWRTTGQHGALSGLAFAIIGIGALGCILGGWWSQRIGSAAGSGHGAGCYQPYAAPSFLRMV